MEKRIARLVPPRADKHWSFQMVRASKDDVRRIQGAFTADGIIEAKPFLQGNDGGWVMVEFWTWDKAIIHAAASRLFDMFGLEVREGDFTREELGLA